MEETVADVTDFSMTMGDITSPSQLQEVTLDQDNTLSNSMGVRSPGGPLRGRSVKEFEEQLANLKKENFNLKLRIYFLEERMGVNFNLDKENIVKKNVELSVEVESLRKEVQQKHELLRQAVKAMELEDDEHKKLLSEKDEALMECQQEIECLKSELIDVKSENQVLSSKNSQATQLSSQALLFQDNCSALEERVQLLEKELHQEKENSAAIGLILVQNDTQIRNLTEQLEEANRKLSESDNSMGLRLGNIRDIQQTLQTKLKEIDELKAENEQLRKRQYLLADDLDKERKRYEKLKGNSEQKIAELQSKLETSLSELKKSQELVVSKSLRRSRDNTDDSFSVPQPTASPRSPQKDALLPPAVPSPLVTPTSSPCPPSPSCPTLEQLKQERDAQQQKIVKLKAEQMKACKIIKSMIDAKNKSDEEVAALKLKIEQLEKELEGVVHKEGARRSAGNSQTDKQNSMDEHSGELLEHYKALTDQLDEKNTILTATLNEKDNQMKTLEDQYEELLQNVKEKESQIVDLEFEILALNEDKDKIDAQLKEKDDEVEKLNAKLLKKNCDLQGLVNNELWEKNREIEKLQKKQFSKLLEQKDEEIVTLQIDVEAKAKQLNLIKEKIFELGIDIDFASGDVVVENHLQRELEKSEKLRMETSELCSVLSKRLEELAIFLDSLLKQKCVLGFLGHKENKRLRQIIDQSLDLSRSFTVSMLVNPEQSLLQLSNISSILNESEETRLSLTYHEDNEIIQTLRQQIVNLKYELQLRDVELNKMNICTDVSSDKDVVKTLNTTSTTLKYKSDQSESEAWSEPDRSVSKARIGLLDTSLKSSSSKKGDTSTESTDDEERGSKSKKTLSESRSSILELHKQVCEMDQKLTEKEIAYYDVSKINNKLKQELNELEDKKQEAEKRVVELEKEKEELMKQMSKKDKDLEDKINRIEMEKSEAVKVATRAQEAADLAKNEMKLAEVKLREMDQRMRDYEESLKLDYENETSEKLQKVEEEYLTKISQIQSSAELEIKALHNTIQQLQTEYTTNYVKRNELEESLKEIERLKTEIDAIEVQMEELTFEKDEEAKLKLTEKDERINSLRSELDNATLQYSEAVLEKTKMANEKAFMEQELSRSALKEIDMKKRLDQVENELNDMKQTHQKQVSALQMQKSALEVRISELESSNAELHNRLIKVQAGYPDSYLSPAPNFVNQIVSFRRQHSENSGYVSEEHALDERANRNFNRVMNQNFDVERNEANSSPDLGIESDHGRFSSLETHIQRPLLETLELTESMNNLLDVERNDINQDCGNASCCQRTQAMANENSDLKRKLLRTRRALEETVTQLTLANQRKKQVEKTICRQIHKTSQVLRKAKANLDSGSETDLCKQ